jgi:hypothetical protein
LKPDAHIAALGARPIVPSIPGIVGGNVMSARLLRRPRPIGNTASSFGAGSGDLELAIYLYQLGK